jgi:hypothetical protein
MTLRSDAKSMRICSILNPRALVLNGPRPCQQANHLEPEGIRCSSPTMTMYHVRNQPAPMEIIGPALPEHQFGTPAGDDSLEYELEQRNFSRAWTCLFTRLGDMRTVVSIY